MEVILLESIRKLGAFGAKVTVKGGFGRNYLIPRNKALRATKANIELFEQRKSEIEQDNNVKRQEAADLAVKLKDLSIVIIRQAGEDGRLFGSVSAKDIEHAIAEKDIKIDRSAINLSNIIKTLGITEVTLHLHSDVNVNIIVNVARTSTEANNEYVKFVSANKAEQAE